MHDEFDLSTKELNLSRLASLKTAAVDKGPCGTSAVVCSGTPNFTDPVTYRCFHNNCSNGGGDNLVHCAVQSGSSVSVCCRGVLAIDKTVEIALLKFQLHRIFCRSVSMLGTYHRQDFFPECDSC